MRFRGSKRKRAAGAAAQALQLQREAGVDFTIMRDWQGEAEAEKRAAGELGGVWIGSTSEAISVASIGLPASLDATLGCRCRRQITARCSSLNGTCTDSLR